MEHHDEHDHLPGMDDISAEDMRELLEEAIADGAIAEGQPSYGIAQAMLAEDQPNLTPKQHEIFDRHVAPVLKHYAERLAVQRRTDSMPD